MRPGMTMSKEKEYATASVTLTRIAKTRVVFGSQASRIYITVQLLIGEELKEGTR